MAEAAAAGLLPHQFLEYTPRMLYAVFAGNAIRSRRTAVSRATWAWQNANWTRAKKQPPLKPIIRQLDPPKTLSPSAMKDALVSAFSALGATVIRRKKDAPPEE